MLRMTTPCISEPLPVESRTTGCVPFVMLAQQGEMTTVQFASHSMMPDRMTRNGRVTPIVSVGRRRSASNFACTLYSQKKAEADSKHRSKHQLESLDWDKLVRLRYRPGKSSDCPRGAGQSLRLTPDFMISVRTISPREI